MPPKSKANPNKKVEKKGVGKSEKKLPAKGKAAVGSKGKSKDSENEKNLKPNSPTLTVSQVDIEDDMELDLGDENRKRSSEENFSDFENRTRSETAPKKLRLATEDPLKKAIEEIELEGASSESDDNAYYNQRVKESFITDADQILGAQLISDEDEDETSEDEAPEYLRQSELEEEQDFFGNFGDVPDVDQVSLDLSVDIEKEKPRPIVELTGPLDLGKFVNPLTGEASSSKESLKVRIHHEEKVIAKVDEKVVKAEEEKDAESEPSDQESVDIPILSDQEKEDEALGAKVVDEEDAFTQFLEFEAHGPIETLEEIDVEALAREENARLLRVQTYEFVQYLINRAVEKSEYVDPKIILRQNLDKRKLMKELNEKLFLLEVERRGKQFLNRKCVEYFRRKRTFRPILDENPKTLPIEYNKFQAAVNNLDHWLIKEEEATTISRNNLEVIREKLVAEEEHTQQKITSLEESIKKTLKRENFDKLQLAVTSSLAKMEEVRKEISDVRFQLIQKQHNMATLVEQLRNLEDLGNGLSMRNFESIQTETQALGKKIEERNTELNKLRYRCYGDIHRMAHLKEKQKMLRDTITVQRQYLEELQIEKQNLREFLFRLKIERTRLRKDIRDISFQSGLLDKPVLMKDYDTTVEHLQDLRNRVENSQKTINNLNEKIGILEKHCNTSNV